MYAGKLRGCPDGNTYIIYNKGERKITDSPNTNSTDSQVKFNKFLFP